MANPETSVTSSSGMLTPSSSVADVAEDFALATTYINDDGHRISELDPAWGCSNEFELDHQEQDMEIEFSHLEYADIRSQRRAKDRLRKQRARNLWHQRADQKRDNPSIFWQSYKCCEICARLTRKSSVGRKLHDRGNKQRSTIDRELILDGPGLMVLARWDEYLAMNLKWHLGDYDPWHWEQQEREDLAEEQFIEWWFDNDHQFSEVDDTLPFHYTWKHYREREAAIRAWLGCTLDDFWIPSMNDERQLKQDAKYRHYRATVPGWVGEKYYDFTPTSPKSKTNQITKASIRVRRDSGGTRLPQTDDSSRSFVENSPMLSRIDWHGYRSTSTCGSDFEVLFSTEECSSDGDWEEITC